MHNRLWIAVIVAATPILALSPVAFPSAHDAGCVRPVPGERYNQRWFTALMRRKDTIAVNTLAVYKVSRVKSWEVKPISDAGTCARAANAYSKVLNDPKHDRQVHVLRVGDRYVVMDPEYIVDDYHRAVTFDSTFTHALAFIAE